MNKNNYCLIDLKTKNQIDFIENGKTLVVLWIDNVDDLYQTEVKISNKESGIMQDIAILSSIISDIQPSGGFGFAGGGQTYYLGGEYLHTPLPSEIAIKIKQISKAPKTDNLFKYGKFDNVISIDSASVYFFTSDEIRIRNYEENWLGLSLGVSMFSASPEIITFDEGDLVKVQKSNKSSLKGKALLLGYLQFPRSTVWKPELAFWKSAFYDKFHKRFSLQFGLSISETPFDYLFAGLGFSIKKSIDIIGGVSFVNYLKDNIELDRTINTIEDIKKLFPTKYESTFFIGASFRMSAFE